ncbi:two-component regulator propeller domain-containing protein [Pedobacter sp. KLB.chiD]|uniref:hybrid sensor histidine kinase/response regulator transcription factor n=1 Tax=Pedobacter sp. KLB.chiD TaxID=3387402 RepID=UPI00399BFBE9
MADQLTTPMKKMMRLKLAHFILCGIFFTLFSGYPLKALAQQFSNLGIEQGLSNNTVTSIYKDKFGFMWFGTLDGLNRYDGYRFEIFRHQFGNPNSLPNDIIMALNDDCLGNIWVGTQTGLAILNNRTLTFSTVAFKNFAGKKLPVNDWINDIKKDNKGNLFVGTTIFGCLFFQPGSKEGVQIPVLANHNKTFNYTVNAIDLSDKNNFWVSTDKFGLCQYDHIQKAFLPVYKPHHPVVSIQNDRRGRLWVGTASGIYHYQINIGKYVKFIAKEQEVNDAKITSCFLDHKNTLWVMTDGEGIIKINMDGSYAIVKKHDDRFSLSSNNLYTLFEDEQSRKWIGTFRGGIDILDAKKHKFRTYAKIPHQANSLVSNFTFSFCEDKNKDIWIGTDGGGLSLWKRKTNSFKNFTYQNGDLKDNCITSVVNHQSEIYLSTYRNGVSKFNAENCKFEVVPFWSKNKLHSVWKLYNDHNGQLWATVLQGGANEKEKSRLFVYNDARHTFMPAPFSVKEDIITIIDDDRENLWLGSFNGLLHANKHKGIDKTIHLGTAVRAICKARSGMLWVGTYGRGLMCYDILNNKFLNYTEANGLCNNKVLNIEEDEKGNIWASTCNGLVKITPASGKIQNFYAADGLQSNQFYFNASAHLSTGELMFGGIKGFNIFSPDSLMESTDFPPLLLSGLRVSNTAIDTKSEFVPGANNLYTISKLELPYDKAVLSVDYVALEYSLPEKIKYAYFLEGRDKAWNDVNSQRTVNYSHLSEGKYRLKIKSTNASGRWNKQERVIEITVLPPWYRTWWAYITYLILCFLLIYVYYLYQKKQTKLKYDIKFERELTDKKIEFFTNISHELRTPITLIVDPVKKFLQTNGDHPELADLSTVYRNAQRLLSLVDQLLLFRCTDDEILAFRPQLINIRETCHEVFLCFINQVKSKDLHYQFKSADVITNVFADREKVELILFNILSNAIKYTSQHGSVTLTLKETDEDIHIIIADTGHGIPKDTGENLFKKFYRLPQDGRESAFESGFGIGLYLAKKYVELHHGDLTYTSEIGKGTVFYVSLPKTVEAEIAITPEPAKFDGLLNPMLKELTIDSSNHPDKKELKKDAHVLDVMSSLISDKPVLLLIDDDDEMRRYIREILEDTFIIFEADNTQKGFETVLENEPDIIVCDVIMSGITGMEFCSKIKESPSFSHIPVILLTGSTSPEIKLKGIECGAEDYITKPFESDLLIARIKSILKGRSTLKKYFFNEITLRNNTLKIPEEFGNFLSKCIAVVEAHLDDEAFSMKIFTEEMCMTRATLSRKIKSISGLSSIEFIRYIRLRKSAELMIQTEMQIKEVAYQIGFQDLKYFREQFNKLFGMNPSDFIRKYRRKYAENQHLNPGIGSKGARS